MSDPLRRARTFAALLGSLVALASGCGGGGSGSSSAGGGGATPCSETARKQFVLNVAREWYLFPELLPATVNLADFATAEDLLDHLTATAREQRKDRFFSYLTTRTEENSLLGAGQFNGFGLRTRLPARACGPARRELGIVRRGDQAAGRIARAPVETATGVGR